MKSYVKLICAACGDRREINIMTLKVQPDINKRVYTCVACGAEREVLVPRHPTALVIDTGGVPIAKLDIGYRWHEPNERF